MLNQVVLVGRLTKDPEVQVSENGKKYASITVAVPRNYKNSDGFYDTDFIRCTLWNVIATNTCEYCHCGDVVGIRGRVQTRMIEEGEKKEKILEIICERVSFLASKHHDEIKDEQVDE